MLGGLPGAAMASAGLDALQHFFNNTQSFSASFSQVVLDETLATIDEGHGTVWVKRPGLFRWEYAPPAAQLIVGDGQRVWLYDIELEQVTLRDQQRALGKTPAIMLAGDGELEENYAIIDIGRQGRFDWLNLVPKDSQSNFAEVRIGFEDNRLSLMELIDTLGQHTRISFADLEENAPIADTTFEFVPPDGVDVIDEFTE